MRCPVFITTFLVAWPAAAADPSPEPPDPELLEFLGEMAGEDEDFDRFMESHEAERALKDAEKKVSKEVDDE